MSSYLDTLTKATLEDPMSSDPRVHALGWGKGQTQLNFENRVTDIFMKTTWVDSWSVII